MSVANLSSMNQPPISQTMTMGLLPQSQLNYQTLFMAFAFNVMLTVGLIHIGAIQPSRVVVVANRLIYTPLVTTETLPAERQLPGLRRLGRPLRRRARPGELRHGRRFRGVPRAGL